MANLPFFPSNGQVEVERLEVVDSGDDKVRTDPVSLLVQLIVISSLLQGRLVAILPQSLRGMNL
jgi:hypothetical protein